MAFDAYTAERISRVFKEKKTDFEAKDDGRVMLYG